MFIMDVFFFFKHPPPQFIILFHYELNNYASLNYLNINNSMGKSQI